MPVTFTEIAAATAVHMVLAGAALAIGLLVGLPAGIAASRSGRLGRRILDVASALRAVPSLAVLFVSVPIFGLGAGTALVALVLLAIPPVLVNTDAGLRSLDPAVREAAEAIGMSPTQRLVRVDLPLALPALLAGARAASVEAIASATLAAFVGAGGLGTFVVRGFALYDASVLLAGAIPVALLALASEALFATLERSARVSPARAPRGASRRASSA